MVRFLKKNVLLISVGERRQPPLSRLKTADVKHSRTNMEGDPTRKKPKLCDISFPVIPEVKRLKLLDALDAIADVPSALNLLKIVNSNADMSACFSTTCFCQVLRSIEEGLADNEKVYSFSCLFKTGTQILKNYLENAESLPDDRGCRLAISRLLTVVQNSDDISRRLQDDTSGKAQKGGDTLWTVRLVHHLLKDLAVNQTYIMDESSKVRVENMHCQCCGEEITGTYGDCSIGNIRVWHGSVDILMGSNSVALTAAATGEPEDLHEEYSASFEVEDSLSSFFSQIISEAIVFAFVRKKYHPESESFLTPTIGISKNNAVFYFYDPENDILLESAPFSLFVSYRKELAYVTILALWLAINHKHFCTGITSSMKSRAFNADFLKNVPANTKQLYTNQVSCGGCRYEPKKSGYFLPQKGHGWILDD